MSDSILLCCAQVRIWKVARKQEDIIQYMRRTSGLENHKCAHHRALKISMHRFAGQAAVCG